MSRGTSGEVVGRLGEEKVGVMAGIVTVSVAEEQSATVLSLQEGYLFPIYVAVLARMLIVSCFHMHFVLCVHLI